MVNGITDYGKRIKMRLVELGKDQNWLIQQVTERTGMYFDSGYMHKIMTGKNKSKNITKSIDEILGFEVTE